MMMIVQGLYFILAGAVFQPGLSSQGQCGLCGDHAQLPVCPPSGAGHDGPAGGHPGVHHQAGPHGQEDCC